MREVDLTTAPQGGETTEAWAGKNFGLLADASRERAAEQAADAITLTNFDTSSDVRYEFDVGSATLDELREIVATLILIIKTRGVIGD